MDLVSSCRRFSIFEAFTAVGFQVEVFWLVTSCSDTVGHQRPMNGLLKQR